MVPIKTGLWVKAILESIVIVAILESIAIVWLCLDQFLGKENKKVGGSDTWLRLKSKEEKKKVGDQKRI